MKQLLLFSTCIICFCLNAQTVTYNDVQSGTASGRYSAYVCKDGKTYKEGDTVKVALPSGTNGKFVTIQKMDIMGSLYIVGREAINTNAIIKKITVNGTKRAGYKAWFQTKGLSAIDNYFFPIEDAIVTGEISTGQMTPDQALTELKKYKDKLDLGLITQDEYDKKKAELTPIINK